MRAPVGRRRPDAAPARTRQRNVTGALKNAQRLDAACALQPPAPVAQIEGITDTVSEASQARHTLRTRTVDDIVKPGQISPQATPDLILNLHAAHRSPAGS